MRGGDEASFSSSDVSSGSGSRLSMLDLVDACCRADILRPVAVNCDI